MKVTIITIGGWKYTGTLSDINNSSLFKVQWLKITTKAGQITVNVDHIVAIIYANSNKRK